jgi:hypothetical protein
MSIDHSGGASVADILTATERLSSVMSRENAALAAYDRATMRSILDEKRSASDVYHDAVRAFACRHTDATTEAETRAASPALDDATRGALRRAGDRLSALSAENQRRLDVALTAHQRMLDVIVRAARDHQPAGTLYARDGARMTGRATSLSSRPISFNQAL